MNKINLDDPRLTAYALGELDADERAAVEAELEESADAREEFERVREFAARLSAELKAEAPDGVSSLALSAAQRAKVEAAAATASPLAAPASAAPTRWTPGRIAAACGAAAAVLVAVTLVVANAMKDEADEADVATSNDDRTTEWLKQERDYESAKKEFITTDSLNGQLTPPLDSSAGSQKGGGQAAGNPKGFGPLGNSGSHSSKFNNPAYTTPSGVSGRAGGIRSAGPASKSNAAGAGGGGYPGQGGPVAGGMPGGGPVAGTGYPATSTPGLPPAAGLAQPGAFSADLQSSVDHSVPDSTLTVEEEIQREEQDAIRRQQGLASEAYEPIIENDFLSPRQQPLSTFSVDVDTASYSNIRRFLKHDQWPPAAAVRIEELVNYFQYDYAPPAEEEEEPGADAAGSAGAPFAVHVEVAACPWNTDHRLARVAIKGKEIAKDKRPISNLVFLVDVSGSMQDANKLPLVQAGLELLVAEMTENDRIAIVTYSDTAQLVLPPTGGDKQDEIVSVIRGLVANGSTNGAAGIQLAYDTAVLNFKENGTNRVLVCTDGDFNVGISDDDQLVTFIQEKAKSGVFLSVFGFGMGNLKDAKLEKLADKGNGHYGYVDDLREAKKLFVEDFSGTMYTIAKDVKLQVEFNPLEVGAYRLIGYENRALAAQDFRDDAKDAGEIGAGHSVTALYEIVPLDKLPKDDGGRKLKYQEEGKRDAGKRDAGKDKERKDSKFAGELFTLWLRYKQPTAATSSELEFPVRDNVDKAAMPSEDFEWAASVAAFGMILRNSKHKGAADFDLLLELALGSKGDDANGHRREFIDLMFAARVIDARMKGLPTPTPPEMPDDLAEKKATAEGKYAMLLKKLPAPADFPAYASFTDYGYWAGTQYGGEQDLPKGHWVYVYPNWYIWGEAK